MPIDSLYSRCKGSLDRQSDSGSSAVRETLRASSHISFSTTYSLEFSELVVALTLPLLAINSLRVGSRISFNPKVIRSDRRVHPYMPVYQHMVDDVLIVERLEEHRA